ncbi:MAG: STAS domain-containing protein [Cyanophyceae cyanobacterium]
MNGNLSNNIAVFAPSGYITAANANEFEQELRTVASQAGLVLLVDMSQVEFLDSSGLVKLVSVFRQRQSRGQRLSLCSITPSVRIVFELTGLDKVFEIFNNRCDFDRTIAQPVAA